MPPANPAGGLSIHRSFVVRFRSGTDVDATLAGRVEHVVSGQARDFSSGDELLEFFGDFLRNPDRGGDR